eukprot:INCI7168.10.p1 GENE.INCI7168.10~~INCI7168.10.p1  ORF type:complete len:187 (-),score=32.18 INCI7168.10:53-577(-)
MSNFDAHCQVPCGIYDDDGRIKTIKEDSTTIRKAISQVQEYARAPPGPMSAQNFNQVRTLHVAAFSVPMSCHFVEIRSFNTESRLALIYCHCVWQMARWVTVKEQHASDIIQTVSEYFLTQKVKPVPRDDPHYQQYCDILATHHSVMVAAMKASTCTRTLVDDAKKNGKMSYGF